jgi:hypothetical protein
MKKIPFYLMTLCMSLMIQPQQLAASTNVTPMFAVITPSSEEASVDSLLMRVNEINEMDKTNLKPVEKRKLRTELRSIKQQLRSSGGGVYISAGAIILIVILLIILL